MDKIFAFPTADGNGFKAFKLYEFQHHVNGLYVTTVNGAERVDTLDGKPSAHLWDGKNWKNAGRFIRLTNPRSYRQQLSMPAAYKLAALGFEVYLAASNEYGFVVDERGFAVSFQWDLGGLVLSGNYHSKRCGTGWRDNGDPSFYVETLTAEAVNAVTLHGAPRWATNGEHVRLSTAADELARYGDSSKYYKVEA